MDIIYFLKFKINKNQEERSSIDRVIYWMRQFSKDYYIDKIIRLEFFGYDFRFNITNQFTKFHTLSNPFIIKKLNRYRYDKYIFIDIDSIQSFLFLRILINP